MCIWGHLRHQLVVLDRLRCPQPHQLKYGRCREETQKETSLTLNETVPLTVGKGTAHLIQKVFCFFWQPLTRVGKSTCNWSLESIGKWLLLFYHFF
ncbi:uncharacterized protein LOC133800261 isoform X5 [Humulus lupulus]|uniref:uncharacterized protein LOC133800261 isoform X5 n=1 Tax=Humulus lupulus TaxID=3486 RepID=UPI002B40791B|nr:uncharacterized protein LOC133800261 isoform X5 [Humulus lupulus]XP_062094222.1 uncharacterized protein LOC133800261 isoform X5 [Humulus lupulus]